MRGQALDDHLLDAAAAVLTEHGSAGFTLERVAAAAGLSRVTLHRRGISRTALEEGLAARAAADWRDAAWPALTGPGDAADRLEALLAALCALTERHLALVLAIANGAPFHDDGAEALTRTEWTAPLERVLRDGAAEGTVRAADPAATATVLFNLVGWTYAHLRAGHRWSARRARTATLDVALRGVLAGAHAERG
jgi:AcrR family transcriptional regulator